MPTPSSFYHRNTRDVKQKHALTVYFALHIISQDGLSEEGRVESRRVRNRVLWVDDEVNLLKSHVIFLQEKGFTITTATNGEDAMVLLRQQNFDLVLLDAQMTGKR